MKIPILIEATSDQRYKASAGEPFVGSVEGDSPQAVLKKMKQWIDDRIAQSALIAALDLPNGENALLRQAKTSHALVPVCRVGSLTNANIRLFNPESRV